MRFSQDEKPMQVIGHHDEGESVGKGFLFVALENGDDPSGCTHIRKYGFSTERRRDDVIGLPGY